MVSTGHNWKRKTAEQAQGRPDLATKIAASADNPTGYGLANSLPDSSRGSAFSYRPTATAENKPESSHGGDSVGTFSQLKRMRLFGTPSTRTGSGRQASLGASTASTTGRSRFTSFTDSTPPDTRPHVEHVVCAISENMARETCVASMDASSPTTLQVTKQGNGQAYSETLAYLSIIKPHEILINEGRRNSVFVRKILELYDLDDKSPHAGVLDHSSRGGRRTKLPPMRNSPLNGQSFRNFGGTAEKLAAPDDEQTIVKFVSRSWFDQTKGAALLQSIARAETYEPTVVEEYIILSAAHAVIIYLQHTIGASLAAKTLTLSINADGTNRMMIDRASLWQLELLVNSKTGKTRNSLVGTIDKTKTTVGARLLRTNIMSPPTDHGTINSRLELVDTFLSSQDFFNDVYEHLSRLPELDVMLASISLVPKRMEVKGDEPTNAYVRMARRGISALISIKTVLAAMPALGRVLRLHLAQLEGQYTDKGDDTVVSGRSSLLVGLGAASSPAAGKLRRNFLLHAIALVLYDPALLRLFKLVETAFTESTTYSKNPNTRQHQECFALKDASDSFLGVYRATFLGNVTEIYKKADEYAKAYGIHVTVRYSSARGYFLSMSSTYGQDLPEEFINCSKNNRSITFTTKAVAENNVRARDCVKDILLMTHERIQGIMSTARESYDAFASISDAIALLDMCHSFADNVTLSTEPWCRPFVFEQASHRVARHLADSSESDSANSDHAIYICNGRFAIATPDAVAAIAGDAPVKPFVSNTTLAMTNKNFTVISGINGSGKSTYLKQIAIIVVLAQCGSYVPAEQANISIRDRLCTRIGNADDQEHSISTFMMEMKETAFICNNATSKSLILLDELGRATSNEEGMSLAWAVAEYLLKKQALTFFVTHYPQLSKLADTYPNVQNVHLQASIERTATNNIKYTYKAIGGACTVSTDYGVELAAACAWPTETVTAARSIESHVQELLPGDNFCEAPHEDELQHHTRAFDNILDIKRELLALNINEDTSIEDLRQGLIAIQDRFASREEPQLVDYMKRLLIRSADPEPNVAAPNHQDAVENTEDSDPSKVNAAGDGQSIRSFANDDRCSSSSSPCSSSSLSDDDSSDGSSSTASTIFN